MQRSASPCVDDDRIELGLRHTAGVLASLRGHCSDRSRDAGLACALSCDFFGNLRPRKQHNRAKAMPPMCGKSFAVKSAPMASRNIRSPWGVRRYGMTYAFVVERTGRAVVPHCWQRRTRRTRRRSSTALPASPPLPRNSKITSISDQAGVRLRSVVSPCSRCRERTPRYRCECAYIEQSDTTASTLSRGRPDSARSRRTVGASDGSASPTFDHPLELRAVGTRRHLRDSDIVSCTRVRPVACRCRADSCRSIHPSRRRHSGAPGYAPGTRRWSMRCHSGAM